MALVPVTIETIPLPVPGARSCLEPTGSITPLVLSTFRRLLVVTAGGTRTRAKGEEVPLFGMKRRDLSGDDGGDLVHAHEGAAG